MTAADKTCQCLRCTKERTPTYNVGGLARPIENSRMFVCAVCGDKRCPHAADHRDACTGSAATTDNAGTPRTDAELTCSDVFVSADFARQLERELAAKTAECEKWKRDWEEESGEHAEHIAQARFELAAKTREVEEAKAERSRQDGIKEGMERAASKKAWRGRQR